MEAVNLSQANQVALQKQPVTNPQVQAKPEEKKNGKKMLAIGAAAAATIAIAGIAIYKGKGLGKNAKLQDIKFDKGIAKKGDELFTGVVKDTLKSGNKVTLEYVDGVIQKAITETDGKTVVKEYVGGVISKKDGKTIDIKKIQNEVKLNQEKLKKLLKDDTLSSEELSKQTDKIKYKSKNQQKEIDKIIDSKAQKEAQLAKEAQEKALKAQKEAQERAAKEAQERLAQQETIELAQKVQNEYFEAMQTPSKSAKESANVFIEAEDIIKKNNDESIDKLITGCKLYSEDSPHNYAARIRMFSPNHKLPEDFLEAYEFDYELDKKKFKTLREYAEHMSDPKRLQAIQLRKIKDIRPAEKEHFLYRGLGPATPKKVIEMLEAGKNGDVIIPDWGVACVTSDFNYAKNHYTDKILLKIKTPIGARLAGCYKDGYPEFHMPSLSEYKFLGSRKIDNLTIYELEYIMPDFSKI